jgi:DNA-directed RNA polymerase subunit RPC12/RpoP
MMPISFDCTTCGKKLRAPDDAGGKKIRCPGCESIVVVPVEILDAETIEEPAPEAAEAYHLEAPAPPTAPADDDKARVACPMCGEMIFANAAKCRFCGEIFDPKLRAREQKKKGVASEQNMTTGDWFVAILCSGIGCIAGVVWMIQGKPKGIKMVGVSFAAAIIWSIIQIAIETAGKGVPR